MSRTKLSCVTLIALGLAAGGCSKGSESNDAPGASQGGEATPAEMSGSDKSAALTDGQIMQILATVDDGEIQQAQVALAKTSNPQVRSFADMMINQHTSDKQQGQALSAQTKADPAPSAQANKLQTKAAQMLEKLNGTEPSDFDKIYIQGQIDQHKEVLNMLNDKLMPAAKDPMLRQQLTAAQSMVQHHIDMAQQIQM
jgi:putative membrane protein